MIPAKIYAAAAFTSLFGAVVAQVATWDITAVVGYIGALGLAVTALYSKIREEKRKQDVLDRDSRRGDCEQELTEVKGDVAELRRMNGDLKSELDRWKALFDSSQTKPPTKGP